MHAAYPAQIRMKRTVLRDTLRSVAGYEPDGDTQVQPSPLRLGYRNRGQYPVARERKAVVTGFFAPRSHRVVAVDRCRIHDERVDQAVACVRAWANRKGVSVYDENRHRGVLRHVVVRAGEREVLVALVGRQELGGGLGDLVRRLRRRVPAVTGLVMNVQPARSNVILGKTSRSVWGRSWIEETLSGVRLKLSVGSFFQVNTAQARNLFSRVVDFTGGPSGTVVDAYCGVGALSLLLVRAGHRVIGIESDAGTVRDARENVVLNAMEGVEFHPGQVERVLPRLVSGGLRPRAVILDPPRKGCAPEVLEAVASAGTPRIGYVSCHPGTLARDLKKLFELGYRVERLEGVDMFPQTAHLEVFAGLVKN
jgi:23S rRNA (uracil1939-C5)-methyltransferase